MYFFGIDVHSTYHKVMLMTPEGELKEFDFNNDPAGRAALKIRKGGRCFGGWR